jgi:hypothetical protein
MKKKKRKKIKKLTLARLGRRLVGGDTRRRQSWVGEEAA